MDVGVKAARLPSHDTGSIDAVYDGHRFDGAVGRERGMVKISSAGGRGAFAEFYIGGAPWDQRLRLPNSLILAL